MTLIGVKSKYGSCSGSCTGLININKTPYPKSKGVEKESLLKNPSRLISRLINVI